MEEQFFCCDCTDFNHVIRISFDPADGAVFLDIRLNNRLSLLKRLWVAFLFIIGRPRAYGGYDEVRLRAADFARLHAIMDRAEAHLRQQTIARALAVTSVVGQAGK